MINPNETKSVFWLLILLVVFALAYCGYKYYMNKKKNNAPVSTPEAPAVETEEENE